MKEIIVVECRRIPIQVKYFYLSKKNLHKTQFHLLKAIEYRTTTTMNHLSKKKSRLVNWILWNLRSYGINKQLLWIVQKLVQYLKLFWLYDHHDDSVKVMDSICWNENGCYPFECIFAIHFVEYDTG